MKNKRFLMIAVLAAAVWALAGFSLLSAQESRPVALEGRVDIVHRDPLPGSNLEYRMFFVLTTDTGERYQLAADDAQLLPYAEQRIRVYGEVLSSPAGAASYSGLPLLSVGSMARVSATLDPSTFQPQTTRDIRDIILLCHFSDSTENLQDNIATFNQMAGQTERSYPHFWEVASYNQFTVSVDVLNQKLDLPGTFASYLEDSQNYNADALATDCLTAADNAGVDFTQYNGAILAFPTMQGISYALGTTNMPTNVDGVGGLRLTWNPPLSWSRLSFIAHEAGHTFGLLHSDGNSTDGSVYDSYWDVMSGGGDNSKVVDNTIGDVPPGTIGYHIAQLDIAASRVVTVAKGQTQTLTLEQLMNSGNNSNPLVAIVPIDTTASGVGNFPAHFLTVEARFPGGYENAMPTDEAVVLIYDVVPTRSVSPAIFVDENGGNVNDTGSAWVAGETYTDSTNKITIKVVSKGNGTFTVEIANDPSGDGGGDGGGTTGDEPAAPVITNIAPNQGRPTISFENDEKAEWYQVWIGNGTVGTVLLDWFPKPDAEFASTVETKVQCEGLTCTLKPNINPLAGTYDVWMQAWGPGGYSVGGSGASIGAPSWNGPVSFTLPNVAPGPITPLTATLVSGKVTLTWEGAEGATWYNIWVGTPAPDFEPSFYDWLLAEDLGCENAGVCTLEPGIGGVLGDTYSGDLTAGVYYVQSWGPGGFSTGGIEGTPWFEVNFDAN